jgi:hypothetical protein
MWKPFRPADGIPLGLGNRGMVTVAGQRAAILICYEQLLVWPILTSALERPTILVGIANDHWATGIPIGAAQIACLHAWSRLFTPPYISSTDRSICTPT